MQEKGAKGICAAVETTCSNTLGQCDVKELFSHMSSLVTNGASVNTGERGSLWTLMDSMQQINSGIKLPPLMKVWCALCTVQFTGQTLPVK